jgi:hypothetical protein
MIIDHVHIIIFQIRNDPILDFNDFKEIISRMSFNLSMAFVGDIFDFTI